MRYLPTIFCVLALLFVIVIHESCDRVKMLSVPSAVKESCTGCHFLPEANSISKELWTTTVLPRMAEYFNWEEASKYEYANRPFASTTTTYGMNDEKWEAIVEYFEKNGLDEVITREPKELPIQQFFKEDTIRINRGPSLVTAMNLKMKGGVKVAYARHLITLGEDWQAIHIVASDKEITQIYSPDDRETYIVSSGPLDPHEGAYGTVSKVVNDTIYTIIKGLKRPVQMLMDEEEIFVAQFGFYSGGFSRHPKSEGFRTKMIHQLPGTYRIRKMHLFDTDTEELVVTLSQGQEGVFHVTQKEEAYSLQPLLRFGPEYGLSDMDIADLNADGLDDLVVANGDNADYSPMPKSYHGVRVYINQGDYNFKEVYHLPLYGATQVQFIDINGDDELDVVTSAYFAIEDEERIIMLLNSGGARSFELFRPEFVKTGSWMVMETGDFDKDGDEDIAFGSYLGGPKSDNIDESTNQTDLLVLTNTLNN